MPEIICTTVYQFPELSDAAKGKARSWYRELALHDDWWDAVYEDFERICDILGVRLKTSPVGLMGGARTKSPASGSLGSGAMAMGPASRATGPTPRVRPRAFAPMRPRMQACTVSLTGCRPSSGATSTSWAPRSAIAAAITTNTPCRWM